MSLLKAILGITAALTFSCTSLADAHLCEGMLHPVEAQQQGFIRSAYLRYRVTETQDGFAFRHQNNLNGQAADIWLLNPETTLLRQELWVDGSKRYRFIDTGFKNLEADSLNIDHLILDHIYSQPTDDLVVHFGAARMSIRAKLYHFRWALHRAVLQTYRLRKDYLDFKDFYRLNLVNLLSTNSDVFGLVKLADEIEGRNYLTAEEVAQNVALTIQVSYPGERNFFRPTLMGLLSAAGYSDFSEFDQLPFEYRIYETTAGDFRQRFYKRFSKATTCEFARYVRFSDTLSRPLHDYFLYKALAAAVRRGMRTIVAAGDSKTSRLFRLYGFKVYEQLPAIQDAEPEYLSYLEVGTPEFRQLYTRLKAQGEKFEMGTLLSHARE